MSLIIDNLKEAIKGENNAQRKYELFSENAIKENFNEVAHIFRATSFAESIHIKNHLKALSVITNSTVTYREIGIVDEKILKNKIKDTLSNLQDAIKGELYETKVMYKKFKKNAVSEGIDIAELSFSLAKDAERVHANLFSNYLKDLKKKKKFKPKKIYVCRICGNIEFDSPPEKCPVCDHSSKFFREIV
ncbi:MAG: rubrerythrin family protein [Candidatus Lokiarchaeota archaeon]|nr:rubrerythrin family protein [Candidatus Lokiarchaeota archaeon]